MLRAIGADEDLAHSSIRYNLKWQATICDCLIRFGIGRFTTEEEVDYTIEHCVRSVNRLREMR